MSDQETPATRKPKARRTIEEVVSARLAAIEAKKIAIEEEEARKKSARTRKKNEFTKVLLARVLEEEGVELDPQELEVQPHTRLEDHFMARYTIGRTGGYLELHRPMSVAALAHPDTELLWGAYHPTPTLMISAVNFEVAITYAHTGKQ